MVPVLGWVEYGWVTPQCSKIIYKSDWLKFQVDKNYYIHDPPISNHVVACKKPTSQEHICPQLSNNIFYYRKYVTGMGPMQLLLSWGQMNSTVWCKSEGGTVFPRWASDREVEVTIQSPLDRVREPNIHSDPSAIPKHKTDLVGLYIYDGIGIMFVYPWYSWCFETPLRVVQAELTKKLTRVVAWCGATASGHSVLQIDTARPNQLQIELKSKTFLNHRFKNCSVWGTRVAFKWCKVAWASQ